MRASTPINLSGTALSSQRFPLSTATVLKSYSITTASCGAHKVAQTTRSAGLYALARQSMQVTRAKEVLPKVAFI